MDKRFRVSALLQKGFSCRLVYSEMRKSGLTVPLSTIALWRRQLASNPTAFLSGPRRKHTGNTKANRTASPLTVRDRLRIRSFVKAHPQLRYRKTAAALPRGITASYSTVRRETIKYGMRGKHRAKKPMLSKAQRAQRRHFAKDNVGFEWALAVLTDEVTCSLGGARNTKNNVYYTFAHSAVPDVPTAKFPIAETRFAAITAKGAIPLLPCPTNPTSRQLQLVLEQAIPLVQAKMGHEFKWLHDNSPAFASASTQEFMELQVPSFWTRHEYPANSPDINAIENALGHMKELVRGANPRSRAELVQAMDNAWAAATSPERLAALYGSMQRRLREVIRAKGGRTRY